MSHGLNLDDKILEYKRKFSMIINAQYKRSTFSYLIHHVVEKKTSWVTLTKNEEYNDENFYIFYYLV